MRDRQDGRGERGETQTERGLISRAATFITFIDFICNPVELKLVAADLYPTTYLYAASGTLKGSAY